MDFVVRPPLLVAAIVIPIVGVLCCVIIIIAVVALVLVGGGVAAMLLMKKKAPEADAEGEDGALHIRQSARVWALRLEPGQPTTLRLAAQRSVYVHLIEGSLQVNGLPMQPGDGLGLPGERLLQVQADQPSHALVFDLRGHG